MTLMGLGKFLTVEAMCWAAVEEGTEWLRPNSRWSSHQTDPPTGSRWWHQTLTYGNLRLKNIKVVKYTTGMSVTIYRYKRRTVFWWQQQKESWVKGRVSYRYSGYWIGRVLTANKIQLRPPLLGILGLVVFTAVLRQYCVRHHPAKHTGCAAQYRTAGVARWARSRGN